MAPFDDKYLTYYLIALVMLALSLTICEICEKTRKPQKVDLENEGQGVHEKDLHHSTENVRILIEEFFKNFSYLLTYVYAKGNTRRLV